jgi:hypothetical protein
MADINVIFKNLSALPIMLDAWIGDDPLQQSITIEPYETRTIYSRHGEWYLHTMFNPPDKQKWTSLGITQSIIGKIRSFPCIQGEYAWIEHPDVTCTHSDGTFEFRVLKV